jgi:hypothetical protein
VKTHNLKIWPQWFDAVRVGSKTFEIRKNDRGFAVGDLLVLEEFRPGVGTYTDRKITRRVTYLIEGDDGGELMGLVEGYCALGLGPV